MNLVIEDLNHQIEGIKDIHARDKNSLMKFEQQNINNNKIIETLQLESREQILRYHQFERSLENTKLNYDDKFKSLQFK